MRSTKVGLTATVIATTLLALVAVGPTSAHDPACEGRLRAAPIETAPLPEGWRWDFFRLERWGTPSFEAAIDADGFAVTLELACVTDPEGLFVRLDELREVAGNDKIGVRQIGDEAIAAREFGDFPTIRWRHGDIVGSLCACSGVDYADLEDFAEVIDGLLP